MQRNRMTIHRIRITIHRNPDDPSDDLRCASRLKRDLWSHSPVEINPDDPIHATHRDDEGNAYFEFTTEFLSEVHRVLNEYGYWDRTDVKVIQEGEGSECVNCGNIPPQAVTVCPVCNFRDIDPCPYCENEVPRLDYLPISGDLFQCPIRSCARRVRLRFQEPFTDARGEYLQPLVRVSPAEAPVRNDV